jgi:hypothetical protein
MTTYQLASDEEEADVLLITHAILNRPSDNELVLVTVQHEISHQESNAAFAGQV